jgi:hypothetical protein
VPQGDAVNPSFPPDAPFSLVNRPRQNPIWRHISRRNSPFDTGLGDTVSAFSREPHSCKPLPGSHLRRFVYQKQARLRPVLDTRKSPPFRGMYQRFYKLFFKHYYAIADCLNVNSSSLTTKLSESTPSLALRAAPPLTAL